MHCTQLRLRLDEFLDGDSASVERADLGAHLASCGACRAELERARALRRALRALEVEPPSWEFEHRVIAHAIENGRGQSSRKPPRHWALVAACAASMLTVLLVRPFGDAAPNSPTMGSRVIAMTAQEPRTISLVFGSNRFFDDVALRIELPDGVEIVGQAGRRDLRWRTSMQAGKNVLPLELVARESANGQIVARLAHGGQERVFRVFVTATAG